MPTGLDRSCEDGEGEGEGNVEVVRGDGYVRVKRFMRGGRWEVYLLGLIV